MFRLIHEWTLIDEWYGYSTEIDFVMGSDKYPDTIKEAFKKAKRKLLTPNDTKEC